MTIKEWQQKIHSWAIEKGFWEDGINRSCAQQACLFHTEISEFFEYIRDGAQVHSHWVEKGKPEGPAIELADLIIRVLDTCEAYGIDIEKMIEIKMSYNETRPYKHGRRF